MNVFKRRLSRTHSEAIKEALDYAAYTGRPEIVAELRLGLRMAAIPHRVRKRKSDPPGMTTAFIRAADRDRMNQFIFGKLAPRKSNA
jgi:hypothetical protein